MNRETREAKQRYVDNVMTDNAEIAKNEGLNEEQTDTLEWLCSIRHKMHTSWESFWNDNSAEYNELWGYIDCYKMQIDDELSNNGLPMIGLAYDPVDYSSDSEVETEEEREQGREELFEMLSDVDNKIQKYLLEIDGKYKTHYCPTGFARL